VRVLVVTGIFPPDIGGPATFTVAFTNWLERQGHDSRIIALWDGTREQFNKKTIFIPRSKNKILRFIKVSWRVLGQLSKCDFLISTGLHEESALALRFKKKKSVARIVGDPVWERAKNSNRSSLSLIDFQNSKLDLKSKFERKLLVWSLNQFSLVICPSLELCELVENWGVYRPTHYIPNGIRITELEVTAKEYDLIVVSRLVKWKNIDQVLEAAQELDLSLLIVGDGPEMSSLQEKSKLLGAKATFLGETKQDRVKQLLQKSKIFIQISSYEGLSFSLLQAMEVGIPCVVSNIPGNLQVAKNGEDALIVKLDNRTELQNSIRQILESPTLALKLVQNSREKISKYFNEEIQFETLVKEFQGEL
jgi:glycosyltransferase involved in cell wall biosynthesis